METTPRTPSAEHRATPTRTVEAFLGALERVDMGAAGALLDDDVVYENVSLPAVRGREATVRVLGMSQRVLSAFEVHTHRLAATGPVVLTERTDVLVLGRVRIAFWVCGTFEVHDGRITLWRDYFDYADAARGVAVGLGRAALSLVARPSHGRAQHPQGGTGAPSGRDGARST